MSIVALIPARGGSKRLPRKNILKLAGKPMLAYPIEAAQASGLFENIYVTTEDEEIASVANSYGAEVIKRPYRYAGDRSTVAEVCQHALEAVPSISIFCCIYATAALLQPSTIVASYKLLDAEPVADFVMGVSKYEQPPVQALKADEKGFLSYMWPEWRSVQSQNYPNLVVSNGTLYWARRDAFLTEKTFYGRRLRGITIPVEQVLDIDTSEDFSKLCERFSKVDSSYG